MFGRNEVLSVCVPGSLERGMTAGSGREAMELLRMLRFDLVLVPREMPDMTAWQFVSRMRSAWSWQKWGLVSPELSNEEEITARTLGAMAIFDTMPEAPVLDEMLIRISETNRRSTRGMHEVRPSSEPPRVIAAGT